MGNQRRHIQRKNGSSPQISGERSADAEKPARSKSKSSPRFSGREAGSLSDVPLTPGDMLYLQRTVGNRAVNRLIQQREAMPEEEEHNRPDEASMVQMKPVPLAAPGQQQQLAEDEQRNRPEDMGMVHMKEAAASGSLPGQAMSPEEEERRKLMEEEQSVYAKEGAGETPSASPDVESQIESMRRRLRVGGG
jgi:hypothetical protein